MQMYAYKIWWETTMNLRAERHLQQHKWSENVCGVCQIGLFEYPLTALYPSRAHLCAAAGFLYLAVGIHRCRRVDYVVLPIYTYNLIHKPMRKLVGSFRHVESGNFNVSIHVNSKTSSVIFIKALIPWYRTYLL